MEKESKRVLFTECSFLRLLVAYLEINGVAIINNHKLEKDLYEFYDNEKYKFLFEDICKKKSIDEKDNHIDLRHAFQFLNGWGITIIQDSHKEVRSIINYDEEWAHKIICEYIPKYSDAMKELTDELLVKHRKKEEKVNQFVKKI